MSKEPWQIKLSAIISNTKDFTKDEIKSILFGEQDMTQYPITQVTPDLLIDAISEMIITARLEERKRFEGMIQDEVKYIQEGIDACSEDSKQDDCKGDELQYIFGKSQALKIIRGRLNDFLSTLSKEE